MGKLVKMSVCFVLVLACIMGSASAQTAYNVTAEYHDFNTSANNWNLSGLACSTVLGDKPLRWRSNYNWTEFCGPVGPDDGEVCGRCLKVTNTGTEEKASTIVRIVDACGINGVILDTQAFDEIDTDGQGAILGHLTVDYEFVDCEKDNCCPCDYYNKWASKLEL